MEKTKITAYQGYGFLWQEAYEIVAHQLALDPIQDLSLKKLFEYAIQYGHGEQEVDLEVRGGVHSLMHNLLKGVNHNTIKWVLLEYAMHAGIKASATLAFPIMYSNNFSLYPEVKYALYPIIKFFGVNPLELTNSIKTSSDQILGSDNIVRYAIEYLTLRKNHYQDRADDPNFEQFIADYHIFMETVDAALHAYDDLSVLYNNRYLSNMPTKALIWLDAKINLYLNKEAEDKNEEQKVKLLRGETHFQEDSYSALNEFLLDVKNYIEFNLANALPSLIMGQYINIHGNQEAQTTTTTSTALVTKTLENSLSSITLPETLINELIDYVSSPSSSIRSKTPDILRVISPLTHSRTSSRMDDPSHAGDDSIVDFYHHIKTLSGSNTKETALSKSPFAPINSPDRLPSFGTSTSTSTSALKPKPLTSILDKTDNPNNAAICFDKMDQCSLFDDMDDVAQKINYNTNNAFISQNEMSQESSLDDKGSYPNDKTPIAPSMYCVLSASVNKFLDSAPPAVLSRKNHKNCNSPIHETFKVLAAEILDMAGETSQMDDLADS